MRWISFPMTERFCGYIRRRARAGSCCRSPTSVSSGVNRSHSIVLANRPKRLLMPIRQLIHDKAFQTPELPSPTIPTPRKYLETPRS